ncbi:hypothetical protein [Litorisediminicola beolgyonensis]|uniref:Bacterial membrane protein YfhO n=1 Tax=Litorisediminicola beolgyonensis TaxID=1173614 RepID=A0ABW3ZIU0_9RHOB
MRASDPAPRITLSSRDGLLALLALAALHLAFRPYLGIVQDAHLYAAQALARLGAGTIGQDLYFAYGNQDSFAPFTRLYAPLVGALGLSPAHMALWALGLALWLAALIALCRTVFGPTRRAFVAVALVLALNAGYGNGILTYGEPFVTPRLFAEAAALLAVTLTLRRLWIGAGLAALLTCALHPLTGLGTLALVLWLALGSPLRFAVIAAVGIGLMMVFAVLGLGPFPWLFERINDDWFAHLQTLDSITLLTEWRPLVAITAVALPVVALLITRAEGAPLERRLANAALVLAALGLAVSLVGGDLLQNRLVIGLQPWRVALWATLFGNLLLAPLILSGPERWRRLLAFAALVAALEHLTGLRGLASACAALGAGLAYLLRSRNSAPIRILSLLPVAAGLFFLLAGLAVKLTGAAPLSVTLNGVDRLPADYLLRSLAAALALAALTMRLAPVLRTGLIAAALLFAVMPIDQRSEMRRWSEGPTTLDAGTAELLRSGAVYWEGQLAAQWFMLNAANYYSCRQSAGVAFFEGLAVEHARRASGLAGLNTIDLADTAASGCPMRADPKAKGPADPAQLDAACRALPDLDLMVLEAELPGAVHRFDLPVPIVRETADGTREAQPVASYHVYACEGRR